MNNLLNQDMLELQKYHIQLIEMIILPSNQFNKLLSEKNELLNKYVEKIGE